MKKSASRKPAAKPAATVAPVAAPPASKAVKKSDVIAATIAALVPKAQAPVDEKKAARDAERAKRFPTAAKADAEKAAEVKAPKERKKKIAVETVAFVSRALPADRKVHVIAIDVRPTTGPHLYAHTHAALSMLGMLSPACPAVPEKALLTIIGQSAVSYHCRENNFIRGTGDTIALTPAGYGKFSSRNIDGGLANAYAALFVDGDIDTRIAQKLELSENKVFEAVV